MFQKGSSAGDQSRRRAKRPAQEKTPKENSWRHTVVSYFALMMPMRSADTTNVEKRIPRGPLPITPPRTAQPDFFDRSLALLAIRATVDYFSAISGAVRLGGKLPAETIHAAAFPFG